MQLKLSYKLTKSSSRNIIDVGQACNFPSKKLTAFLWILLEICMISCPATSILNKILPRKRIIDLVCTQNFPKINISYPLIHTWYANQDVKSNNFYEHLAYVLNGWSLTLPINIPKIRKGMQVFLLMVL